MEDASWLYFYWNRASIWRKIAACIVIVELLLWISPIKYKKQFKVCYKTLFFFKLRDIFFKKSPSTISRDRVPLQWIPPLRWSWKSREAFPAHPSIPTSLFQARWQFSIITGRRGSGYLRLQPLLVSAECTFLFIIRRMYCLELF